MSNKKEKQREIILNRIQCNSCKDVISSYTTHDYNICKCGKVAVDGGTSYLKRAYDDGATYTEMTIYSNDKFVIVRENFRWGTFGKDGRQPLTYIRLCDLSTEHITAILDSGFVKKEYIKKLFVKELKYRKRKNIKTVERVCKVSVKK